MMPLLISRPINFGNRPCRDDGGVFGGLIDNVQCPKPPPPVDRGPEAGDGNVTLLAWKLGSFKHCYLLFPDRCVCCRVQILV